MREQLDLLGEAIGMKRFDRVDDRGVQEISSLQQHAAVGDLVSEGVLEGIFELREKPRLVHEFGRLQPRETALQIVFAACEDSLENGVGNVGADDGGGLQQLFVRGIEPIDARGDDRLHGRRNANRVETAHQAIGAARARKSAGFGERAHAFLEEQRIALGALDQQRLERRHARVAAEQPFEKVVCAFRGQWIDSKLAIIGFSAPGMPILRPIVEC